MDKLRIEEDGIEKKLDFNERHAKGIFIVSDNKFVKKNCSLLKIELEAPENELDLIQKVTVIGKTGMVSIRIDNEYYQYILMPSAEREEFLQFLKEVPSESHAALNQAFNMRSIKTMGDLDFLGGGLSNSN